MTEEAVAAKRSPSNRSLGGTSASPPS